MTDERDDDSGVPVRSERVDSGAHVTESGRHVTNRNVVSRGESGLLRVTSLTASRNDAFDSETPVLPQPLDVPALAPPTRDSFDVITPVQPRPQAVDSFDALTPPGEPPRPAVASIIDDPALGNTAPGPAPRTGPRGPEPLPPVLPAGRRTPTGFLPGMRMPRARSEPIAAPDAALPEVVVAAPTDLASGAESQGAREEIRRATPAGGGAASHGVHEAARGSTPPGGRAASVHGSTPPGGRAASEVVRSSPPAGAPAASEGVTPDAGARAASPISGRAASEGVPHEAPGGRAASPVSGRVGSEAVSDAARIPTERGRGRRPASEYAHQPVALDRALRVVAILFVFALGAAGLAQPTSVLRGGIAWLAFLFFVLAGWGTIAIRVARAADPDAGQRAALGIAAYLAVAGPLVAIGALSRPVILFLICIGFAGFAWREATVKVALWHRIRDGLLHVRANPALGGLVVVLVVLAAIRVLGAIATLDRNPWDDDLAYTPLIKRLLDTGNLIEPFSFRRLGAYGGQTVLQALGAARGSLANLHMIDKGLGFAILALVTTGYARERRTQPLWLALIALTLVLLPETAVNTASYWIGAAGFLALYRCIVREQWMLVGATGAAICTLRQNFLVPVAALVAIVLIGRLITLTRTMPRREAWRSERVAWIRVGAVALAVIVWWWIAALRASHTFLFPMFDGTWNHALTLTPAVTTWTDELAFFVTCALDTPPFAVLPVLAVVLAFLTDRRLGRPLSALVIASLLGFAFLVHGLIGTEPYHLWRYAFGFTAALVIAIALEVGAEDDARVALAPLGRWLVLAALVLQLALGRGALVKQVVALLGDIREAAAIDRQGDPSARAEQRRYTAMQAQIPAGGRVIVMVDEPALLDFRRNAIANLDTPGFASPGTQLPMFTGAEPLRAYLVAEGYRYAAFVRSERSRYFFRRMFWLERMFTDIELFQIMSAYTIAAIDGFAELATTTTKLYDADGLVVLDLSKPTRAATTRVASGDEPTRRGAWVRALADREGVHDAWSLNTRADLRFEDGVGTLRYVDGSVDDPAWYEVSHARSTPAGPGHAIRPAQRRVHLRVRGTTDMRLKLAAAVALNTVFTHPRLDVSLDGELLASVVADATGHYAVDVVVPRARLAGGWRDVYLVFSSVADPAADVRDLRIARLESVEWSPP